MTYLPAEDTADAKKLLHIYLDDHLAGATGAIELARRAARGNKDTELGAFLSELIPTLEEDRDALLAAIGALGETPSSIKPKLAWVAEKLGRLKTNGRLTKHSPLSVIVELEGLITGSRGRVCLFETLAQIPRVPAKAGGLGYEERVARAREQLERLDELRLRATLAAFAPTRAREEPPGDLLQPNASRS